jgi:diguanylate cyclase (GGDEF)-like protein
LHRAHFSNSERYFLYWAGFALFVQLVSNFLTPLTYLGHFLIDAWICLVLSIVLPLRSVYLRTLVFAYLFVATALCLTKVFSSLAHQVSIFVMLILSAYTGQTVGAYIHQFRLKLLSAEFELQRKEITDPLTGVANRREFLRNMDIELQRHQRLGKPLSVMILEVDQLKQFNLQYGAGTSDMILVEVSKRLQRVTRNYDCLARYGMDEFVVLLPEAVTDIAGKIAIRAQSTINGIPISASGTELKVSGSVGIASLQDGDSIESLLRRAENDLKSAKSFTNEQLEVSSQDLAYA